jgi:LacI family transcriptional regulator
MKEVAALAGVSVGTVSNVLAGLPTVTREMRERVEHAVRELHYQPDQIARSLKTRQTRTLGMVVSDIVNPFFADVISGAEDAAARRGYALSIVNSGDKLEQEIRAVEVLRARRVDGLLVVPSLYRADHRHLLACQDAGVPVVCMDRIPEGIDVDTVCIDNVGSARGAVEHLIALGHKRIACLSGTAEMYVASSRQLGYEEAMRAAGLPMIIGGGDFTRESGRVAMLDLMRRPEPPTAALCGNLQITLGAMHALKDLGRKIPGDLALVTFDYFDWLDVFHPQLTSIVQPAYQIGFEAAELLMRRLSGAMKDEPPCTVVLPTTLRIAESTDPSLS